MDINNGMSTTHVSQRHKITNFGKINTGTVPLPLWLILPTENRKRKGLPMWPICLPLSSFYDWDFVQRLSARNSAFV